MNQIVDVHAHFVPKKYLAAVRELTDLPDQVAYIARFATENHFIRQNSHFTNIEQRLSLMDDANISHQILSFSSPNIWVPDAYKRSHLVRIFNDGCSEVTIEHPQRFSFFANLPLPFIEDAVVEAERALALPGSVGIGISPRINNTLFTDEQFWPLYQYLNQHRANVFLHPDPGIIPGFFDSWAMAWTLGAAFEDAIALYQLIASNVIENFPEIHWIIPHCGGALPALAGRLDELWAINPDAHKNLVSKPTAYLQQQHIYVDCATPQYNLIALAKELCGERHLFWGSDFPYCVFNTEITKRLQEDNEQYILQKNALRILK